MPWRELPAVAQISLNFFSKLWLQRHLIWNFVLRDLKSRYVGSLMGFFWSVIHPFVLLLSYTFVFQIVFQIRPADLSARYAVTDNFAVFLFCGILPWLFFQESLVRSCSSVIENANLIRKTVFPSEILPVALVISNLVPHLIGLAILLVVLTVMGLASWTFLLVPVYLVPLAVISLGLGWLLASLQVFLRDTAQILSVGMIFWFWFTPIFYAVERVPEAFRPLLKLNPLSAVVEGYRGLLLTHTLPDPLDLGLLALLAGFVFIVGGWVFRNTKRDFVDVL